MQSTESQHLGTADSVYYPVPCSIEALEVHTFRRPTATSHLNPEVKISYCRARNVKSQVTPSKVTCKHVNKNKHLTTLIPLVGMYQCKKKLCPPCQFVKLGQKTFHRYYIKEFYNWSTEYVVYCLACPCGLFHVVRTIRTLCKRFGASLKEAVTNPAFPDTS